MYSRKLPNSLATSCKNIASQCEGIIEETQEFHIVYAGLCQHSMTDLARGIMMNEREQSVLSKAQSFISFKHSKITSSLFVFSLSPTSK